VSESRPTPGAPSDYDTLQNVLAALAADGFDGEAYAVEGGSIRWQRCHHDAPASGVDVARTRRMEGASDPADMLLVAGVTCPVCGDKAALVLHYGPTAGPADADVLVALRV
jgi:hypothetical protein